MPVITDDVRRRMELQYHPALLVESQNQQEHQTVPHIHEATLPVGSTESDVHFFDGSTRGLPKCPIREDNLDDSYVAFIMYCNPAVPTNTDTTELRRIFRAPPKSDGKTFSTFALYLLIQKLEMKEIKTWAQLAIDLGVEPPALDKGQSAQKVQQYAVRLKRWMHAMHIDSFFEYLLGKPHVYWTQVPSIHETASEAGRDGVTPEEDLALRALLPETRPKRGRRKNEDRDEIELEKSPSQRPRLDSPTLSEDFMMARAAIIADTSGLPVPENELRQSFTDRIMPWSATEMKSLLGTFRWPPQDGAPTPLSAYPQSAVTPTNRSQMWSDMNEPQSAITPKSRSRRRHGPAVSSAWPSYGSASTGKLRGRPPSNRSVTDGPFSTFPANPSSKDVPTINLRDNTPNATPIASNSAIPHFFPPVVQVNLSNPPNTTRPNRLQLQVPPREGGNVRLATPPPPVLLVNGLGDANDQRSSTVSPLQFTPLGEYFNAPSELGPGLQHPVNIAFRNVEGADRANMGALETHFTCEILAAEWCDVRGEKADKCSIDEAEKICKQVIKNLQAESSSNTAFLINLSALAGGPLVDRLKMTRLGPSSTSQYECHWKLRYGSIEGDFKIRVAVQRGDSLKLIDQESGGGEDSWKKKYLDLQQQIKDRDTKVQQLKRGVLDALVASNQYSAI